MPSQSETPGTGNVGEELLPRFKVQELLGEGTSGWVFQCFDTERQELVAVKVLRPEAATDEESVI